jgi:hypothetical protein
MQTITSLEKNKSTFSVANHKNKQQSFFAPARVQPKLNIGAVNDPYEREADVMADRVMSKPVSEQHFFKTSAVSNSQFGHRTVHDPFIPNYQYKTKLSGGGIKGLKLDATFSVTDTPCDTLQIVQVFWGTPHEALGKGTAIGKYTFTENKKQYDAFVDGGVNSPYVTLSGNSPAHPDNPYYLTAAEHKAQVTFAKDAGTIQTTDQPTAVAHFDEAYFETAVVAVNYDAKKSDKVLNVFKWGWKNKGVDAIHGKGENLGGVDTGITSTASLSTTAKNIITSDYPKYKIS